MRAPNYNQLDLFEAKRRRAALRDYQGAAFEALAHKAGLCVMATGTGKTEIICALAYHLGGPGLVLAHTKELVDQLAHRLSMRTGLAVGVEQAERKSSGEPIVVASMATACKPRRLDRFVQLGFRWLVIDEAHRARCRSYEVIREEFPFVPLFGFTATPYRYDKRALGAMFREVRFNYPIEAAIDDGWLVPLIGEQIRIKELDISEVPTSLGDLQPKALDNAMLRAVEGICQELVTRYPESKGPLFWPGKFSARLAHERLNQLRPGSSVLLTEDMPALARRELRKTLSSGAQWLCNVNIATEGFDWPEATIVGWSRPTESLGLFTQGIGRGTRPLPGVVDGWVTPDERKEAIRRSGKPECLVLDFVGNCGRHKLISLVDIMSGSFRPAEVKRAKEIEAEGKVDPLEALKSARRELSRLTAAMKSNRVVETRRFDFFSATGVRPVDFRPKFGDRPATIGQINFLLANGVPVPENLEFGPARRAIGKIKKRTKDSKATVNQLRVLNQAGFKGRNIGLGGASLIIGEFERTGQPRPHEEWMEFLRRHGR